MTDFDPGDGWRKASPSEATGNVEYIKHNTAETVQVWLREEPVPALPTRPYTVIRVEWKRGARTGATDEVAFFGGDWIDIDGTAYTRAGLHGSITGFEVLSEPRAVTAKAVLDRVESYDGNDVVPIDQLAREFGVES